MLSTVQTPPRWGNQGRNRKALIIEATLVLACGEGVRAGQWLDVGCGSGEIASSLATRVTSMTGVDPEPWPDWVRLQELAVNLSLKQGRFDSLLPPVPESAMDIIVCNQVYEHVEDPEALIGNLFQVLKAGGHCYFAGPNLLWPIEPHVRWPFVHWLPRRLAQQLMKMLGSGQATALDAFSSSSWRLRIWFREAGFDVRWVLRERLVAECESRGWIRLAALVSSIPRSLFGMLEPISPGFIYVLSKPVDPAAK